MFVIYRTRDKMRQNSKAVLRKTAPYLEDFDFLKIIIKKVVAAVLEYLKDFHSLLKNLL